MSCLWSYISNGGHYKYQFIKKLVIRWAVSYKDCHENNLPNESILVY